MNYTLSDFDYNLPDKLIAQQPAHPRDHARLLVYDRQNGELMDDHFYNLLDYLPTQTTLVVNNSKVEKCRLLFDNGRMEIFVLKVINDTTVKGMVRPGKKFKKGRTVALTKKISAEIINIDGEGLRTLKLSPSLNNSIYEQYKRTPFPPYIKQNEALSEEYQTVYAESPGSKAAPTAGLHFTDEMWHQIRQSSIRQAEVTLHVGLGTFAPVKDSIADHTMHQEWFEMNAPTAETLNKAAHITAVGTTSVRVLESNRQQHPVFKAEKKATGIFIKPGYKFLGTDALITNFHLPKSTLLMLVSAFMGFDEMKRVYEHAIRKEYRFYSFGDAMLIL